MISDTVNNALNVSEDLLNNATNGEYARYKANQRNVDVNEKALKDAAFLTSRLFGGPIMFNDAVDPHIKLSSGKKGKYIIGRATAQTIATNPTIVSISPGKAVMLPFMSGIGKTALISDAINNVLTPGSIPQSVTKSMQRNKIFYRMGTAYNEYINHVNLLARILALYIGIGDEKVPNTSSLFKEYDWANYYYNDDIYSEKPTSGEQRGTRESSKYEYNENDDRTEEEHQSVGGSNAENSFGYYGNDPEDTIFGQNSYVHFYANMNTSYDENTSTSTRQSSIQSLFEGQFSDTVKDIQFLFGGPQNMDGILGDTQALVEGLLSKIPVVGSAADIAKAATNYLRGGKLIFPEMIDDSTYSKSITVGMRLSSPTGDPVSIFLYCLLPLAHIMAFAMPRQIDNNMCTHPFLVNVYSKGYINCDMGVISSVRIQRGGEGDMAWNADGLATDIDITMDITPLHNELMISSSRHPFLFLQNSGLQDYLGVIAGLNMRGDTVMTQIDTIKSLFGNYVFKDGLQNAARGFQDWIYDKGITKGVLAVKSFLNIP